MSREAYFPTSPINVERISDSELIRQIQQEKSIGEIQTIVEAEVEEILTELEVADAILDLDTSSRNDVLGRIACTPSLW